MRAALLWLSVALWALMGVCAKADTGRGPAMSASSPAQRIIVKLRASAERGLSVVGSASPQAVTALAARRHFELRESHALLPRLHVLSIGSIVSGDSLPALLARVRADPAVEYAEVDARRYPLLIPNDALFPASVGATGQWYLQSPSVTGAASATDAVDAWNTSSGSAGVVIADVDTGVRFEHPDLLRAGADGRLLPGHTFISDETIANNFATWNADPSDPGDWIDQADLNSSDFSNCAIANSSWHGTRVMGVLGALTNNGIGIAGMTWHGWLLPVRALGKCGGRDSDIETAILWAAGFNVSDDERVVPVNPYPARIINLSLGASGSCPQSYQDVINAVSGLGVLIVAAAGNSGGPVQAPANCSGVVAVAGLRQVGTKVGYSNLGPEIALGAPAGNCGDISGECMYTIDTSTNLGTTTPEGSAFTDEINYNIGTSFSTPIVSGIAALMLSVNGNLTPAQLLARLKQGASAPFPISSDPGVPLCHLPSGASDVQDAECSCTTSTCGVGMANALGALNAALRPIAAIRVASAIAAGQSVLLDAIDSAAACNHAIAVYAWTVTTPDASVSNAGNGSSVQVSAPSSGTVTVAVTVTDDAGNTDSAQLVLTATTASTSAPSSAGSAACPAAVSPTLPITVAVFPVGPNVQVGIGSQQFTATVTGSANSAVDWEVDGIVGGNSTVGTISSDGLYVPPMQFPTNPVVTVRAIAAADPSATGFAGATLTAPVAVSIVPLYATLIVGSTQSFAATVSNSANTAVTWSVNGISGGNAALGTVSASGVYQAPSQVPPMRVVQVSAVSSADPSREASASVTIVASAQQPTGTPSGSGGGGAFTLWSVGALALLVARAVACRRTGRDADRSAVDRLGANIIKIGYAERLPNAPHRLAP